MARGPRNINADAFTPQQAYYEMCLSLSCLGVQNTTASTINFIQNTGETFNGATNINVLAGKTAIFVQMDGQGVYGVFII